MPSRALEFLTARQTRVYLSWALLLLAVGHRAGQAWINFRQANRPCGNDGYTSIDFAGQWIMGRLVILGHGRELYSRARHLEVARASFPVDREPPNKGTHDAEQLIEWYVGPEDDPVGGPLYPPVHAFFMVPIALISDPYVSYRVTQGLMLALALLAGAGVRYGTHGRWWWTAAAAFLVAFPGCRGAIDLGQNSPLTLALLVWGWALMVRGRLAWGGVLWGLLAFKPVWAVSFLGALLLMKQWRAALAMTATGAAAVLVTLPVVGVQAWFDWLHIGKYAAETYATDRNWNFLSRDLFGIPRRMLLEFSDGRAAQDRPIAGVAGWALWLTVVGATVLFLRASRGHEPRISLTGPRAGLVLLAAWLCTYRFMYYDALIAAVGVVVVLADPRPFFRRAWWPFASWAAILAALLLVIDNVTAPLNVEVTASIRGLRATVTDPGGATRETAPTVHLASGDYYPWDTVTVLGLWLWCGIAARRQRDQGPTGVAA